VSNENTIILEGQKSNVLKGKTAVIGKKACPDQNSNRSPMSRKIGHAKFFVEVLSISFL
jgi:hypothetical protein